jgi:hypothetical protein
VAPALRLDEPDTVYRNVVRLASRLGYKPAPTQTVYEYTGMLADVVPQARDSLGSWPWRGRGHIRQAQLSSERLAILAPAQKLIRQASAAGWLWRLPRIAAGRRTRRPNGRRIVAGSVPLAAGPRDLA